MMNTLSHIFQRTFLGLLAILICNISFGQIELSGISGPAIIFEGSYNTYSVSNSGNNSSKLSCHWKFGDGQEKNLTNVYSTGHIYDDNGSYTMLLKVTNEQNESEQVSRTFQVENVAPNIKYLGSERENNQNLKINFETVVHDPGKDKIKYSWDFGDGNTKEGFHLQDVSHNYQETGTYEVVLKVDDGDGGTDQEQTTVHVFDQWHAEVSGDINTSLSGKVGLHYQTFIDTSTKEIQNCFKVFTLYDDANRSYFWFGSRNMTRMVDNSTQFDLHGYNKEGLFDGALHFDMVESMYENQKMHFQMQELYANGKEGIKVNALAFADGALKSLSLFSDMKNFKEGDKSLYGQHLDVTDGTIRIEPIKGNRMKGSFNLNLSSDPERSNEEEDPVDIHVQGDFDFPINKTALYQIKHGCEEADADPFTITTYTPRNGKENINPLNPCIEVEFSEAVDLISINDYNVQLGYYDENNQFLKEDIVTQLDSDQLLRIIPRAKLRNGIKYEVRIKDGVDGIISIDGGQLMLDEQFQFSTIVEPNEYKVRVYQSLSEKPLIEGKNTMVRLEILWEKPANVAESSWVKNFPIIVTMKDKKGTILNAPFSATATHQSLCNDYENVRMARNSINIYGWKPKASNGDEITIEIKPDYQSCTDVNQEITYEIKHPIRHEAFKAELNVDCYLIRAYDWKDSIPSEDMATMKAFLRKNMEWGEQMFPIQKINYEILTLETNNDFDQNENLIQCFKELSAISTADVITVFVADGQQGGATYTWMWEENKYNLPLGRRFIKLSYTPKILTRGLLTHEIGHSFKLEHIPYATDDEHRTFIGNQSFDIWEDYLDHDHINGFRIMPNGKKGFNKSCEEGNGESMNFCNFMFPVYTNVFYWTAWINDMQYADIINHLESTKYKYGYNDNPWPYNTAWASLNPIYSDSHVEEKKTVFISGKANQKTGQLSVDFARFADQDFSDQERSGSYEIQAIDLDGKMISTAFFNPFVDQNQCNHYEDDSESNFFTSLGIPASSKMNKIQIVKDNKVLDELEVSANEPEVSFVFPKMKDTLSQTAHIEWTGMDADQDVLTYTLMYSPTGNADWSVLTFTKKTAADIDVSKLKSGESPVLRIQASDGFYTSYTDCSVHIDFPLHIESYGPIDSSGVYDDIRIQFSNPVIADFKSDQWFRLYEYDQTGNRYLIPYSVTLSEDQLSAQIIPDHGLKKGYRYQVAYGDYQAYKLEQEEARKKPEKKKKESFSINRSIDKFLGKQVDKQVDPNNEETKKDNEFLKDILGIKKEEKPANAPNQPTAKKDKQEVIKIRDIYGNYLDSYISWKFEVQ